MVQHQGFLGTPGVIFQVLTWLKKRGRLLRVQVYRQNTAVDDVALTGFGAGTKPLPIEAILEPVGFCAASLSLFYTIRKDN